MPQYTSYANDSFWSCYNKLPQNIQVSADKAYELFKENPQHPSLHFKKVGKKQPVYAARITENYRALGYVLDDSVYWFWAGNHRNYEKMIKEL